MRKPIKIFGLMAVALLSVSVVSCDDEEEPYVPITAENMLINRLSGCKALEETFHSGVATIELLGDAGDCTEAPKFSDNVAAYCTPNPTGWTVHYTAAIDGKIYPLQYFMPGTMVSAPIDSVKTRAINNYDAAHPAGSSTDDVIEVTFFALDDWFAFKADSISAADMFGKLGMPADTDPKVLDEPKYTVCSSSLAKDFKGTKTVVSNHMNIRPIQLATRPEVYEFEVQLYSGETVVVQKVQYSTN